MVMVFRRRFRSMSPINRVKHVVDSSGAVVGGTSSRNDIVTTAVVRPDPYNPSFSVLGSTINAIFLSIFVIGSTGAPLSGPIDWYIAKSRSGQNPTTNFPEPGNTGVSEVRSQIFHEEKGLSGSGDGTPMVFKGVIAIPKHMRRVREGDVIFVKISATTGDTNNFCIKAIYNEFSW